MGYNVEVHFTEGTCERSLTCDTLPMALRVMAGLMEEFPTGEIGIMDNSTCQIVIGWDAERGMFEG